MHLFCRGSGFFSRFGFGLCFGFSKLADGRGKHIAQLLTGDSDLRFGLYPAQIGIAYDTEAVPRPDGFSAVRADHVTHLISAACCELRQAQAVFLICYSLAQNSVNVNALAEKSVL